MASLIHGHGTRKDAEASIERPPMGPWEIIAAALAAEPRSHLGVIRSRNVAAFYLTHVADWPLDLVGRVMRSAAGKPVNKGRVQRMALAGRLVCAQLLGEPDAA
jgi:hypothetical protein